MGETLHLQLEEYPARGCGLEMYGLSNKKWWNMWKLTIKHRDLADLSTIVWNSDQYVLTWFWFNG
jgi:hypothetical protein